MIGTGTGAETGAETHAYTGAAPSVTEAKAVFATTSLAASATAETRAFAGAVHVSPSMAGTSDLGNRPYIIDECIYRHTHRPPALAPEPLPVP